jgi:hypothetical protein
MKSPVGGTDVLRPSVLSTPTTQTSCRGVSSCQPRASALAFKFGSVEAAGTPSSNASKNFTMLPGLVLQ